MKKMDFTNARAVINIRGKQIPVDSSQGTADDIRRISGIKPGRTIMVETEQGMTTLQEGVRYSLPPRAKYKDAPGVRKAASYGESDFTYGQHKRQNWCNQVILQQIADLEKNFTHEDIMVDDVNNPIKIMIPHFKLPEATRKLNPGYKTVPLLIVLPDQYPFLPPVGFYIPEEIRAGKHSGFPQGYHGAFTDTYLTEKIKFRWYCSSIVAETWEPAHFKYVEDWKKGDNLWNVISLITEVMSDFSDD